MHAIIDFLKLGWQQYNVNGFVKAILGILWWCCFMLMGIPLIILTVYMDQSGYSDIAIYFALGVFIIGALLLIFKPPLDAVMIILGEIWKFLLIALIGLAAIGLVIAFPWFFFAILVIIPLWIIAMKDNND